MRQCSLHMVDLCLNYCIQYETVFTAHGRFVFKLLIQYETVSLHMVDLCLNYCIQYETVFTAHGRFVFKLLYTI